MMKAIRQNYNDEDDEIKDRLSDLSNGVLLHILSFSDAKHAVQTCILSKRWKNLWKTLPILTLNSDRFCYYRDFDKFVYKILSLRDGSTALHSFDLFHAGVMDRQLLPMIVKYAVSHHVQRLQIHINCDIQLFPSSIFSCHTLTSLELYFSFYPDKTLFPNSLNLPALTNLSLLGFIFCVDDHGSVDPFSKFNRLNSLYINACIVDDSQQSLCISSATLTKLRIHTYFNYNHMKFQLSTPSLCTFVYLGTPLQKLCGSMSNLSSVKHVNIVDVTSVSDQNAPLVLLNWLVELTNIESLTVSLDTLTVLSLVPDLLKVQFPSLYSLKSLKVLKTPWSASLPKEKEKEIVNFLLQNAPSAKVTSKEWLSEGMTKFTQVLNREWNEE